ncbi:TerD family protein [uncultured Thiodictyon sp.]|uniref:TerD family protein n=1 Tax=uncultured Thiodictyon sp. TaxID=1846217 RepID=UPI0025EE3732|nr:TerD family protein [uncultured Thiodictyon sp.]
MDLQSGQNAPVGGGLVRLALTCDPPNQAASLDVSAFMLNAAGRVSGDGGFVFYGNPSDPAGAVRLDPVAATFQVDLARVPMGIERVVIALSIDPGVAGLRAFSQFRALRLSATSPNVDLQFPVVAAGMTESALIMGELYLRNGAWKLRALGQGFVGGLAPLARNYGVDVSEAAPAPAAAPAQRPPAPPTAPSRIDLKKREPISLEKPAKGFGQIEINLNWTRGQVKRGLFGGKSGGIDLDLGCMVEHADGDKDVIQALGERFGRLDAAPFAKLLGDDRTGESDSGETLLINGDRWAAFKRVLIYAFIYDGAPHWAAANAVVTVQAPGSPELVVALDEHSTGKGMCAIALLENDGGRIRVTKLVEYFAAHPQMDEAYRFGFQWQAGRK